MVKTNKRNRGPFSGKGAEPLGGGSRAVNGVDGVLKLAKNHVVSAKEVVLVSPERRAGWAVVAIISLKV